MFYYDDCERKSSSFCKFQFSFCEQEGKQMKRQLSRLIQWLVCPRVYSFRQQCTGKARRPASTLFYMFPLLNGPFSTTPCVLHAHTMHAFSHKIAPIFVVVINFNIIITWSWLVSALFASFRRSLSQKSRISTNVSHSHYRFIFRMIITCSRWTLIDFRFVLRDVTLQIIWNVIEAVFFAIISECI